MIHLKKISVVILMLIAVQLQAQDFPYYYFTTISPMANNPSMAAINDKINADFTVYNLWAGGFKPVTDYIVSFSMAPDFRKRKSQSRSHPWVGLGAAVLKERVGAFTQFTFQAIYAYHIPLSKTSLLSFGICGMFENINIDINSLTPLQVGDPRLTAGNNSDFIIDGGFGTTFRDKNLRVSFSALNLMPGVFQFENGQAENISSYRKFFLAGNYIFKISDKVSIQPDLTLRNSIQNQVYYDASFELDLHYLSLGVGYRSENSIFIYTQIPFRNFVFSYCSEYPLQSTYMIGKGHTFSLSWSMKKLK